MFDWIFKGVIGAFLGPMLKFLEAKDNSKRDIKLAEIGSDKEKAVALVQAEIQANAVRGQLAPSFKLLIYAIAIPYVIHSGAIMIDSTVKFCSCIPKAPPPYDVYEGQILLSFFVTSTATVLAKAWVARSK